MIGVYEVDFNRMVFVNVNTVISDGLGYDKSELIGNSIYKILTPESIRVLDERIKRLRNGEYVDGSIEASVIGKDGKVIKVFLDSFYRIQNGRITGALVAVREMNDAEYT